MAVASKGSDVTTEQLARYARLIYDKVGIVISPQKATLLSNRLRRRLRATGIESYDKYYETLKRSAPEAGEWADFLEAITTHETYLFRDDAHWEWLRTEFIRDLVSRSRSISRLNTVRVWSAACSTGDEAVTIACCLADRLPKSDWKVDILGTDVGVGTVAQAQSLKFGERAMRFVPSNYRRMFFDAIPETKTFTPKEQIRKMLRFRTHNLLDPLRESAFDLVVLKNVLIYFDSDSKRRVLHNVRKLMAPHGYLITGAAEGVAELLPGIKSKQGWLHSLATNS
jgi:chemotaxis protein methyltransferase CheR